MLLGKQTSAFFAQLIEKASIVLALRYLFWTNILEPEIVLVLYYAYLEKVIMLIVRRR